MINRIATAVIVSSLLVGIAPFALDYELTNQQSLEFKSNGTVVNDTGNQTKRLGLVTEPNLQFGSVPMGAASIKFLNITADRKSLIKIKSTGNISEVLEYNSKSYFEGNKEVSLKFNASKPGYYEGVVHIDTQTPRDKWGKKWIELKSLFH